MNKSNRITPEFVMTLKENEIFVFGCRNSGRHLDGASAFALQHFGAVMGQREGLQGQSYAIPTIGHNVDTITLDDIRQSIKTFTRFAAEHPDLHFLVTAIGCGGAGWTPELIAPLFSETSELPNVSLPEEFWDVLEPHEERQEDDENSDEDSIGSYIRELGIRLYSSLNKKLPN